MRLSCVILNRLARFLDSLASRLEDLARDLKRCPSCGGNPETSPPCQ